MAEVIFLTVRSDVMSLKRLYLRIYNYSAQITFSSKLPICSTVINEYILFWFMWKRIWRKLQKIGDIPLTWKLKEILFNRKRWFYYSNQQTFCFNNTRSLFMFCTQKHISNVTHKRTSSGDKGFSSHLANSNWFDYLESLSELAEMFSLNASKCHVRL